MYCGEFDEAEIGLGEFVVSGRDAAKLFEFSEEAFDAVTCGVQSAVIMVLVLASAPWRDHRAPALVKDEVVETVSIVGAVCEHCAGVDAFDQSVSCGHLVLLTGAHAEANGQPQRISHGMELGAKTPA